MFSFIRRTREFSSKQEAALASRPLSSDSFSTKARTFLEHSIHVPINRMNDYSSYLKAGSKQVWATFRACHLVAGIVTSTEFVLAKEGDDKWEPTVGSPEWGTLNNPNPYDSLEEMLYLWTYHMKLCGCAFWLKDELNGKKQPLHIYPLLPQFMQIVPSKTNYIDRFIYRINSKEITFKPEEIIYFRRPHPADLVKGMGDIEPSESLYNSFINRNTYEEKFIEHGAQPSGVLTLKETMTDKDEWARLKAWWNSEYGGKANAGKTAFLSGEWSYHQLGLNQQQMQSLERDKVSVEQIFMNHGVPLSIAGVQGAANYATARVDELNFRKYEIVPLLDLLVMKLNAEGQLYRLFDPRLSLGYELSGLVDVEQVVKEYGPLVDRGAMTPNQLRVVAGLPKVDNPYLDQYFVNRNLIPIEVAGLSEPAPVDTGATE